jgi:LysR family glycine cleavage system transcriptional activator
MSERLPPLNALKAFEAAARQASFARAAQELHVTPAAISHQIRNLEEFLGVRLFDRDGRATRLTRAGQAALPLLQDGFGRLAEAVQQMRTSHAKAAVSVWAPPALAAKWLVPRLSRFAAAHPGTDVQLSASVDMVGAPLSREQVDGDLRHSDLDLAIRFGEGDDPDGHIDKLLSVAALPLCSPQLLHGDNPLRAPADLAHHVLLHDETDYPGRITWRTWLDAAGATAVDATRGPRFNQAALALDAAIAGQGVVLTLLPLARLDLAAGRLIAPFPLSLPLRAAYYLVSADAVARQPHKAAFRQWLIAEARAEEEGSDAGGVIAG